MMRRARFILAIMVIGVIGLTTLPSCEKETASVSVNALGDDGDVTGDGGSTTATHNWTNSLSRAELNMDIPAANGGSFQIIVLDADGNEVINETLTKGVGDDSKTVCSDAGTAGEWTVTIKLTAFDGDGSFTLSQGC